MINKKVWAFFLLLSFPSLSAQAYWVWSPEQGKFVNAEGAAQNSAEEEFDYAMKFYREKNFEAAEERFKEILKRYPQSRIAPEAQYRLGGIYEESGDFLKAFNTYKKLVESYPQSERFNEVVEREFRIGNVFLSGKKAKFAGLEILPSLPKAIDVFDHIVKNAPYSDFGDKAQFQLGIAYKKWRRYAQAVEAFQAVLDQYPQSELVAQARFELAETSFLRSTANVRDQRALDDASKQVDRYLTRDPQPESAERAETLRQQIDEKNAEKNYRIGLYYEKDNYMESALIYYSDIAKRYPHTQWGQKAAEKLRSLKEPAKYVSEEQAVLDQQETALRNKLVHLEKSGDKIELDITKRSLERLEKHRKSLEKDKKESIERRKDDISRRESELKIKFKNLEKKKKLLEKNPSEDLKRAIDRWYASLVSEQESLDQEKKQLAGWKEELGIHDRDYGMGFLPFIGEGATELQKIQQIEAKKFYKLSEEKQNILEEKELLYKHHSEVAELLQKNNAENELISSARSEKIQKEILGLEAEISQKTQAYEKQYGKSFFSSVAGGMRKSLDKSWDMMNPFGDKPGKTTHEELLERQMHLKERITAQQGLVETLSQAFDSQIALQEQKRLAQSLESKEKVDPQELRKKIRAIEREIRGAYEEVEERHKHKKQLLDALDEKLKDKEHSDPALRRTLRMTAAPVTGAAKFVRSFFFGLPHKDVELTESASKTEGTSDSSAIKALEEEIRGQSMIIDAKSREILNKRKELEILKAQASLSGGYKFRSVFIDAPYLFFDEAIDSARRLIPKKNREEILINRLNQETEKLEELKADLKTLDQEISGRPSGSVEEVSKTVAEIIKTESTDAKTLEKEIEALQQKLEVQKDLYREELKILRQNEKLQDKMEKKDQKRAKKLAKELGEIEDSLKKIIHKEGELEKEETEILEKRIQRIEKRVPKIQSKAITQDLLNEKERMESRVSQIESRKDFLSKELRRFEPFVEANPSRSS